ncbi:MAG: hypothetical protein ACI4U5_03025 [Bacilli bacterium]
MSEEEVLKQQKKIIFLNLLFSIVIFLCLSFCFFINKKQYPLGILLGTFIASINHWLLYLFSGRILLFGAETKKKAFIYYLLRMFIFAMGLTLCLLLDYFHVYVLSWITYLVPFVSLYIILIFVMRK